MLDARAWRARDDFHRGHALLTIPFGATNFAYGSETCSKVRERSARLVDAIEQSRGCTAGEALARPQIQGRDYTVSVSFLFIAGFSFLAAQFFGRRTRTG